MSENFIRCIDIVLKHEGGYVNDPNDPGGETNFGITKRSYPWYDIKSITREEAIEIYHDDYWMAIKGDEIKSGALQLQLLDSAVNIGVYNAIKMIQKLLETRQDGIMGPITIKEINLRNGDSLAKIYMRKREEYYKDLVKRNPKLKRYLKGWINRIGKV